jgi:cytidylate kinase
MIIAVDGPAASGKGTIARALGRHFGLPHLDSGKLYRAVALAMLRAGRDPGDAAAATTAAQALDTTLLDAPELTLDTTAFAASIVSAHPGVRAALVARQRAFADQPGGR